MIIKRGMSAGFAASITSSTTCEYADALATNPSSSLVKESPPQSPRSARYSAPSTASPTSQYRNSRQFRSPNFPTSRTASHASSIAPPHPTPQPIQHQRSRQNRSQRWPDSSPQLRSAPVRRLKHSRADYRSHQKRQPNHPPNPRPDRREYRRTYSPSPDIVIPRILHHERRHRVHMRRIGSDRRMPLGYLKKDLPEKRLAAETFAYRRK